MKKSRLFTASLKPYWDEFKVMDFLARTKGHITVWGITHDKDTNKDTGELIEPHTHLILEYATPRAASTVANLLGVPENLVEYGDSKQALMKYLTHANDKDKYQYEADEVFTNTGIAYQDAIMGSAMTDKEIAEYLLQGKGFELLGIVPSHKLRTIQAFLQFDRTGQLKDELTIVKQTLHEVAMGVSTVANIAQKFERDIEATKEQLQSGFTLIAQAIKDTTTKIALFNANNKARKRY